MPNPNVNGQFQLENISVLLPLWSIKQINITDEQIKSGMTKIHSIARLRKLRGKLKDLIKDNRLLIDGSHNPLGAKVLNEYLESFNCDKHIILGMMANKDHQEYISYFKNIKTVTVIDIPNQPNSINGKKLKDKLRNYKNIQYKENIFEAIRSIPIKKNDLILITGSLHLAGEVLNLN